MMFFCIIGVFISFNGSFFIKCCVFVCCILILYSKFVMFFDLKCLEKENFVCGILRNKKFGVNLILNSLDFFKFKRNVIGLFFDCFILCLNIFRVVNLLIIFNVCFCNI